MVLKKFLSTSSIIRPSFTIRASIFEKVYPPLIFNCLKIFLCSKICSHNSAFPLLLLIELHLLPLLPTLQARASKQAVSPTQQEEEGKSCIGGAKYATKEYLPPPSKMSGITFHFLLSFPVSFSLFFIKLWQFSDFDYHALVCG